MSNQAEYKALKKVWYSKLKATGFNDIEQGRVDLVDGMIKGGTGGNDLFTRSRRNQEYYYLAYQFLHSGVFESEVHKVIWGYHSEGISVRNIAKLLKNVGSLRHYKKSKTKRALSFQRIWVIITEYENKMKTAYGVK